MVILRIIPGANIIEASDESRNLLLQGRAGIDDAWILQEAIDSMKDGGELFMECGRYVLSSSVSVNFPVTLCGEGRGTVVVLPPDNYAFMIFYDGRCPERCRSNFGVPKHVKPGRTWDDVRMQNPAI